MKHTVLLFIIVSVIFTLCACGNNSNDPATRALSAAKESYAAFCSSAKKSGSASSNENSYTLVYDDKKENCYYIFSCSGDNIIQIGTQETLPANVGKLIASSETLKGVSDNVTIYLADETSPTVIPMPTEAPNATTMPYNTPSSGATAKSALSSAKYALDIYINNTIDSATPIAQDTAFVVCMSETQYFAFLYDNGKLSALYETVRCPDNLGTLVTDANAIYGIPTNVSIFIP